MCNKDSDKYISAGWKSKYLLTIYIHINHNLNSSIQIVIYMYNIILHITQIHVYAYIIYIYIYNIIIYYACYLYKHLHNVDLKRRLDLVREYVGSSSCSLLFVLEQVIWLLGFRYLLCKGLDWMISELPFSFEIPKFRDYIEEK